MGNTLGNSAMEDARAAFCLSESLVGSPIVVRASELLLHECVQVGEAATSPRFHK